MSTNVKIILDFMVVMSGLALISMGSVFGGFFVGLGAVFLVYDIAKKVEEE